MPGPSSKPESAKERLRRLAEQTTHNQPQQATPPATPPVVEQATPPATPPVVEQATPPATPPVVEQATPPATPPVVEQATPPATPPTSGQAGLLPQPHASTLADGAATAADALNHNSQGASSAPQHVDETVANALVGRANTEVEKSGPSTAGQFVTTAEMMVLTLQRADNANMNVRGATDLVEWLDEALDDMSYATGLSKTAITTLAIQFLKQNWDDVVRPLAGASRKARRRSR